MGLVQLQGMCCSVSCLYHVAHQQEQGAEEPTLYGVHSEELPGERKEYFTRVPLKQCPIPTSDNTFQRLSVSGRSFPLTAFGEETARQKTEKMKEKRTDPGRTHFFEFFSFCGFVQPIAQFEVSLTDLFTPHGAICGAQSSRLHGIHMGKPCAITSGKQQRWWYKHQNVITEGFRKWISKASRSRSPWPSPQLSIRLAPGTLGESSIRLPALIT